MEKILEQIFEKLDGLDNKFDTLDEKFNVLDNKVSNLDEKFNNLDEKVNNLNNKVSGLETDITLIKTQLSEHSEILQAVRHAQETQKAQIDQLMMDTAHLSGKQEELNQTTDRLAGDVSFLVRKAAEHDEDIRSLRRAK